MRHIWFVYLNVYFIYIFLWKMWLFQINNICINKSIHYIISLPVRSTCKRAMGSSIFPFFQNGNLNLFWYQTPKMTHIWSILAHEQNKYVYGSSLYQQWQCNKTSCPPPSTMFTEEKYMLLCMLMFSLQLIYTFVMSWEAALTCIPPFFYHIMLNCIQWILAISS